MAFDFGGDTTNFTSGHFTSFPPQASIERDRLRLQRELDRDLDHPSFSSSSISGLENAGRPFNYEEEDETNTFDIDNDARATSTRKVNFNANMLPSSPAVSSRILATEFADFSMAGNEYTQDSVEMGRAKEKQLSSQDYARAPLSSRIPPRAVGKPLREAYITSTRGKASPILKQSRQNSVKSDDTSEEIALPLNKNILPPSTRHKEPANRLVEEDTFDLSKPATKKSTQNPRQISESSTGSKPRKTTEQVSGQTARPTNGVSGGPRVEDDASSVASLGDLVTQKTRRTSKTIGNTNFSRGRDGSLRAVTKATEAKDTGNTRRKSSVIPNTTTCPEVPKSFKSTAAFIRELGLGGHNNLQDPPTYDETIDLTNQNNPNDQSFLLPNLAGISELIGVEATRIYNNTASARKRNPHGQPPSHKPIESIPVPQDNRDILMAMQLLQDKVAALEEQKSVTEKRCEDLREQLRRTRQKYEKECQRARIVEEELVEVKNSGSPPTIPSLEGDTDVLREKIEDKEREKIAFMVERLKFESTVSSYKAQMDEISHRYEITRIALKNMQDERNSAVNSAAAAIASQRHLQEENERLQEELDTLRSEKLQFEERLIFEREAWRAKEQILRKRVDKAREAEGIAREAINGLRKKLEQSDKRTGTKLEQENEVTEILKSGLQGLKPEVVSTSAAASSLLSKVASRTRFLAPTLATHSAPATISISAPTQKDSIINTSGKPSTKQTAPKASGERFTKNNSSSEDANETAYTIDGNYIRRIADEIEEERRRRKEAEKRAAATSAEMERIRDIVGTKTTSFRGKAGITVNTKRQPGNPVSEFENNITVNVQNFPSRPLSAPPTSIIYTAEATNGPQKVSAASNGPKAKKRRIKKVVYYEEGDTTEIVSTSTKGRTTAIEQQRPKHPVAVTVVDSSSAKTISPPDDATFYTAKKNISSNSRRQTSNADYDYDQQEANNQATLPPPPMIPNHIKSVIDPDAEHDPLTCTVCLRPQTQGSQEDSKKVTRAHVIDSTAAKQHPGVGYEELSSLRPSQPPQKQLNKVVRGLQDEFIHLKMAYQEKAEEFLSLDPSRGRRRRKEITREVNEMVAEMDWKCDMIYALYDVAEEIFTARPKRKDLDHKPASSLIKGKTNVNFMHGINPDEEVGYFQRRPGGGLVDVEDVEDSEEYHRNTADLSNVNMGRGSYNEVSLLDESGEVEDDTTMQVARHLAKQGRELDRNLGNEKRAQKEDVMLESDEDADLGLRV